MESILPRRFEGDESLLGVLFRCLGFVLYLGEAFAFHADYFVVEVANHFLWLLWAKEKDRFEALSIAFEKFEVLV